MESCPQKLCANLIEYLRNIIFSQDFLNQHRKSHKNFTRNRKLPFPFLVLLLLDFVKGSYQDELDKFFQTLNHFPVAKRVVSKAALTKARMKLKYEAFIELSRYLTWFFYKHFDAKTWRGHRLLAIDGSTLRLPQIEDIAHHFGVWKVRQGPSCPMARVSQMFDPLNKLSIDALISPKKTGEIKLAAKHCLNLFSTDLLLMDRGYPAFWLFKLILSKEANFCTRISWKKWKIVRKFYLSGKKEEIIELAVPPTSVGKCRELGMDTKTIKLRLIRVELSSGEVEILITSLIDKEQYPHDVFMVLYHQRWPVEEDYKTMKCWLELENFSGKSVLSVYQDFHAKVFSKNLTSALAFPTQEKIKQNNAHRKYDYQLNFTQALSKTKDVFIMLFQSVKKQVIQLISALHDIFAQTIEPVRPGRKYPRNHKVSRRKHFACYKSFA